MRFSSNFLTHVIALAITASVSASHATLRAQDVHVRAYLDTTDLRIGEQTRLHLRIEHPNTVQVQFPIPTDSLSKNIEIVERSGIDSSEEQGHSVQQQFFVLTSFSEGNHEIPPLTFNYRKQSDTALYSIQTQALILNVQSIPVDTTQQSIHDIKPVLAIERTFAEIAPYVLIALILIAGIAGAIYYWRKRTSKEVLPAPQLIPERPAFEIAMEEMEKLRAERLWQNGAVKEYHSRLTDIIRVYVEQTYHITTLEATTDEIIRRFYFVSAPAGSGEMLRTILEKADMVKFARYEPLPDENDRSLKLAVEFITLTALQAEPAEPQPFQPIAEKQH